MLRPAPFFKVPPVQLLTTLPFLIRNLHSESFFPPPPKKCRFMELIFAWLLYRTLQSSSQRSRVAYLLYPHDLPFLLPTLIFISYITFSSTLLCVALESFVGGRLMKQMWIKASRKSLWPNCNMWECVLRKINIQNAVFDLILNADHKHWNDTIY